MNSYKIPIVALALLSQTLLAFTITNTTFSGTNKQVRVVPGFKLLPGTRISMNVQVPPKGSVCLKTGRYDEEFSVHLPDTGKNGYQFYARSPDFEHRRDSYFTKGGTAKVDPSWPEVVRKVSEKYQAIATNSPNQRATIAVELRGNRARYLFDGRVIEDWEPTVDMAGTEPSIILPPNGILIDSKITKLPEFDSRFTPIDLSYRFNATGIDSGKKPVRFKNNSVTVGRVPFELDAAEDSKCDNLDVGKSWVREGSIISMEEPGWGAFGGRWKGVLNDNPLRLQFRLPNIPITAIHLLAVSDSDESSIQRLTAQFYRPLSGFPASFRSGRVPASKEKSSLPSVKDKNGNRFYLVTIPLDPSKIESFRDQNTLEVELTKDTQIYSCYPDPCFVSEHGAGLPSAVHVVAMTLESPAVEVSFDPCTKGSIWLEREKPAYDVALTSKVQEPTTVSLKLTTKAYGCSNAIVQTATVALGPNQTKTYRFTIDSKRFGHHTATLSVTTPHSSQEYNRTFAFIRNRERWLRDYDVPGHMFGYWNWNGGHGTPDEETELELMGKLGMESTSRGISDQDPRIVKAAKRNAIRSYWSMGDAVLRNYSKDPEKSKQNLRARWCSFNSNRFDKSSHVPIYGHLWAEPSGLGTDGIGPEFYGGEPLPPAYGHEKQFTNMVKVATESIKIARELSPLTKMLLVWGDPGFVVPFLQADGELAQMIDGFAFDTGFFDRLPEQQLHQCSLHRMYLFKYYWNKVRKDKPFMFSVEGPCISRVAPGSMSEEEQANHIIRASLILSAYGINHQFSIASIAACEDYWGEQHYGGGLLTRLPELNPHLSCSAVATHVRNMRHMVFKDYLDCGTPMVYALRYEDARNKKPMIVVWSLRGQADLAFQLKPGMTLRTYDSMDNSEIIRADRDGKAIVRVGQAPMYVYGANNKDMAIALQGCDHSDSLPTKHTRKLCTVADTFTTQRQDNDDAYVHSFAEIMHRFPAKMDVATTNLPTGKGLAITLPKQEKGRGLMPHYTTLVPSKPILIPGKAASLAVKTYAEGDWGRIVYVLRDAKGEQWISVGTKNEWNCDDPRGDSTFNFNGWRYVRIPLPANAPFDHYRESTSTTWGAVEKTGDRIVDLPLSIEKIFIERRENILYVNEPIKLEPSPVILTDILAEYDSPEDVAAPASVEVPEDF